jgi:uncharacterized protein (TIGR00369 family)
MSGEMIFHSACFACGSGNKNGLQLKFVDHANGSTCRISVPDHFQSYEGIVHGGIVATILDAAMVHSLHGKCGVNPLTCRLEVRYLRAVTPGSPLTINAKRKGKRGKIELADAEIICSGERCAYARGAFTFG